MSDAPAGPIFHRDGDRFMPTAFAAGPWDPGALHGGSAGALMAWAMEQLERDPEMAFARVTCEFLRPVPVAPLTVTARVVRPGHRVLGIEAEIHHQDELVARASGLRIRAAESDVTPDSLPQPVPPPSPESGHAPTGVSEWGRGLIRWVDLRLATGEFWDRGPAMGWFRLGGDVVEGSAPTPLQQVVVAADFGNGLSGILDFRTHLFINPDLTIYLHRYPRGEWVGLDSQTWAHPRGVGLAESQLWDQEGPIGRSLQSLVVGRRG